MNNKNIKERYNKAIDAFMNSIVEKEESTVLKIEKIETTEKIHQEYDEYKRRIILDKADLGKMILAGIVVTILSSKMLFVNTNSFELEAIKDLTSILVGSLGTFMIPVSIEKYQKNRFNSNIEANKNLKEYEEIIEKEKVNVKRR